MKELTRLGTNMVFSESDVLFGNSERHKEQAVDKFLETLKAEILAGRVGEIEATKDFVGSKNIRVTLEAYKHSIEDAIVKKLNAPEFKTDDLFELGAFEVSISKLSDHASDKMKCRVVMEGKRGEPMFFYHNGNKWRQKINF